MPKTKISPFGKVSLGIRRAAPFIAQTGSQVVAEYGRRAASKRAKETEEEKEKRKEKAAEKVAEKERKRRKKLVSDIKEPRKHLLEPKLELVEEDVELEDLGIEPLDIEKKPEAPKFGPPEPKPSPLTVGAPKGLLKIPEKIKRFRAEKKKLTPEEEKDLKERFRREAVGKIFGEGYGKETAEMLAPKEKEEKPFIEEEIRVEQLRKLQLDNEKLDAELKEEAPDVTEIEWKRFMGLKDRFIKTNKDFFKVNDSFNRIDSLIEVDKNGEYQSTAFGDLALIFNYMKMLDPGSVVRESEYAQAAATGKFGSRVKAWFLRWTEGTRLDADMRKDLFLSAQKLHASMKAGYSTQLQDARLDARAGGVPENLVDRLTLGIIQRHITGGSTTFSTTDPAELLEQSKRKGTWDPDFVPGKWYQDRKGAPKKATEVAEEDDPFMKKYGGL